mgnify:CR=1 FL=1
MEGNDKFKQMYDREENRQKDLSIPLFDLEQRTLKLESEFQTLSLNLSAKLVNEICIRLNNDVKKYLPKIQKELDFNS